MIPLLQAEEDRDLVRRHLADQAREKELLGENIKVYHSDRLAPLPFVIRLLGAAPAREALASPTKSFQKAMIQN